MPDFVTLVLCQAVDYFFTATIPTLVSRNDGSFWLLRIDAAIEFSVEKSLYDVKMTSPEFRADRDTKQDIERGVSNY